MRKKVNEEKYFIVAIAIQSVKMRFGANRPANSVQTVILLLFLQQKTQSSVQTKNVVLKKKQQRDTIGLYERVTTDN